MKQKYQSDDFDFQLIKGNKFLMDIDTDYLSMKMGETELQNVCDLEKIVKN